MKNHLLFLCMIVASIIALPFLSCQTVLHSEHWKEDINYLEKHLLETHTDLFHTLTADNFHQEIQVLKQDLKRLSKEEIIIRLAKIVSSVKDGHTRLWLIPNAKNKFSFYPFQSFIFNDGWYIIGAEKKHQEYVGARITHINGVHTDTIIKKITPLIPQDNKWQVKATLPIYASIPEVLVALKIIETSSRPNIRVKTRQGIKIFNPKPVKAIQTIWKDLFWSTEYRRNIFKSEPLLFARDTLQTPLYLQQRPDWVWYEYLPDNKMMYVHYDAIANNDNEGLSQLYDRLFRDLDKVQAEKLVLDLRHNGGGNNMLNKDLILKIIKHDRLNRFGKLFVITSRFTFSAASHLVLELEKYTNALLIGEPTGGRPNHFGDARSFRLPNSQLRISASSVYWQNSTPFDQREASFPYLYVPLDFDHYTNNEDPVLQAIASFQEQSPLEDQIKSFLQSNNIQAAKLAIESFAKKTQHRYVNTSSMLNRTGYRLKSEGKEEMALEIFKLNIQINPDYANGYDSLAEAYLDFGKQDLALKYYQMIVSQFPKSRASENAKNQIQRLKQ